MIRAASYTFRVEAIGRRTEDNTALGIRFIFRYAEQRSVCVCKHKLTR